MQETTRSNNKSIAQWRGLSRISLACSCGLLGFLCWWTSRLGASSDLSGTVEPTASVPSCLLGKVSAGQAASFDAL